MFASDQISCYLLETTSNLKLQKIRGFFFPNMLQFLMLIIFCLPSRALTLAEAIPLDLQSN